MWPACDQHDAEFSKKNGCYTKTKLFKREITPLTPFYAQKSKYQWQFWEIDHESLDTCSTCTSQVWSQRIFSSFLSLKIFRLRWSTFSEKILTDKKSGKTNKPNNTVIIRWDHIERVCKIARSGSEKRRGHPPGKRIVCFEREPVCSMTFFCFLLNTSVLRHLQEVPFFVAPNTDDRGGTALPRR